MAGAVSCCCCCWMRILEVSELEIWEFGGQAGDRRDMTSVAVGGLRTDIVRRLGCVCLSEVEVELYADQGNDASVGDRQDTSVVARRCERVRMTGKASQGRTRKGRAGRRREFEGVVAMHGRSMRGGQVRLQLATDAASS